MNEEYCGMGTGYILAEEKLIVMRKIWWKALQIKQRPVFLFRLLSKKPSVPKRPVRPWF